MPWQRAEAQWPAAGLPPIQADPGEPRQPHPQDKVKLSLRRDVFQRFRLGKLLGNQTNKNKAETTSFREKNYNLELLKYILQNVQFSTKNEGIAKKQQGLIHMRKKAVRGNCKRSQMSNFTTKPKQQKSFYKYVQRTKGSHAKKKMKGKYDKESTNRDS